MLFVGEFNDQGKVTDVDPVDTAISYGLKFWFLRGGESPRLTIYSYKDPKLASQTLKVFTDGEGGFNPSHLDELLEWTKNTAVMYGFDYSFYLCMEGAGKLPGSNVRQSKLVWLDWRRKTVKRKAIISPGGNNIIFPHPQEHPWGGRRV